MYREASEVFDSHAYLNLYGDDFSTALEVLRRFPLDSLQRLRRLQFTMTVGQCDGWGVGALASGYPPYSYPAMAEAFWEASLRPEHDYRADWQAIVEFLANHVKLPRLSLTININLSGWEFQYVTNMLNRENVSINFAWFRFVYDFYIGISTSPCSLKEVGAIYLELWPFSRLEPWLEREIMGCRNRHGSLKHRQPASLRLGMG